MFCCIFASVLLLGGLFTVAYIIIKGIEDPYSKQKGDTVEEFLSMYELEEYGDK